MGYEFNSYPEINEKHASRTFHCHSIRNRVQDQCHTANGIGPALCCSFHHVPSLSSLMLCSETQIQKTLHRNRDKFILAVNQRKGPGELGIF